jgi:hypothetical protein
MGNRLATGQKKNDAPDPLIKALLVKDFMYPLRYNTGVRTVYGK